MKKIFFFDIDGTILPIGKDEIPKTTKYAIKELIKEGHEVFIATGKSLEHASWVGEELEINSYIATNGQIIYKNGEMVRELGIKETEIKSWIKQAKEQNMTIGFQGAFKSNLIAGANIDQAREFFKSVSIKTPEIINDFNFDYTVGQMWIVGNADTINYDKSQYKFVKWPSHGGDLLPVEASKGTAIIEYINQYLDKPETYGFGDGYNDVEMFDVVQNAVSMGNAPQSIKDLATAVTTNSEDDGIYNYLVENKIIKGLK